MRLQMERTGSKKHKESRNRNKKEEAQMDSEIKNFTKIWISAISSLCFCYFILSRIPRGILRLVSLLPIIYLFIILPIKFNLSYFHLAGPTIFYLVWLGNFKLLLFAFDNGPLSSPYPQKSLLYFISIALLPIKLKQDPPPQTRPNPKTNPNPSLNSQTNQNPSLQIYETGHNQALLVVKAAILSIVIFIYGYREYLHPFVILFLYCCHVYIGLELILAITAVPVRAILGLELQPQFNEPYLATSLQDFWGRRWNLMVSSILRPTVYDPIRRISANILGSKWGPVPAMFSTFLVSGLMHEIIYYYLTRVSPTWEVTWFFVFHGICTAAEVVVKKAVTCRWGLHRAVSGPLTVAFVAVTGYWWFFPQIIRNGVDLKVISEYSILVDFVKDKLPLLTF